MSYRHSFLVFCFALDGALQDFNSVQFSLEGRIWDVFVIVSEHFLSFLHFKRKI